MKRRWLLLLVVVLTRSGWGADVDAQDVEQRTDEFHATLIEALQTGEYTARFGVLEPAVGQLFDFPTIARISLGSTWKTLAAAQQDEFVELLRVLVVSTYADRFDEFDDQRFERTETAATRRGWAVKTELVRGNGERVNLDYYYQGDRVFNVVADGVSDLSLRRADYNSIIKQEGYDALIGRVKANVVKLGEGR